MRSDCVFCKIVKNEIPANFVYKSENVLAFRDTNPSAPVHILIIPVIEKHIDSINQIEDEDREIISELFIAAKKISKDLGISETGYKLVFNVGRGGGQIIDHLHLHLLGGWSEKDTQHLP